MQINCLFLIICTFEIIYYEMFNKGHLQFKQKNIITVLKALKHLNDKALQLTQIKHKLFLQFCK